MSFVPKNSDSLRTCWSCRSQIALRALRPGQLASLCAAWPRVADKKRRY
jgi:hypothetical protein